MADNYWIDLHHEEQLLGQAQRRRRQMASARASLDPATGESANGLLAGHSGLSAGLLNGLLATGTVDAPAAEQLADEDDGGGFWDKATGLLGDVVEHATDAAHTVAYDGIVQQGIKPLIRGVTGASVALSQELVQRPLTALGGIPGLTPFSTDVGGIRRRYNDYGDSAGLNLLQGDLADEDPDNPQGSLGTGFFAGGRAQAESEAERTLEVNGERATLGRVIAANSVGHFSEPGDFVYDLTAGVSGFAVEVAADPLALATAGASKGFQAARVLDRGIDAATAANASRVGGQASSALEGAMLRTGLVRGARRDTIIAERTRDFFADETMLQRIADADAYDIMQMWSRSPAKRIDNATINMLGEAKTQSDVADVLFGAIKSGELTQGGFFKGPGHFVRKHLIESEKMIARPFRYFTLEGKLSGLAPRGLLHADDVDDASLKLDSLLRQANVDRAARAGIYNRMVGIEPGSFDQLFDVTTDAMEMIARQIPDDGKGLATISDLSRNFRGQIDSLRKYGVDSFGDDIDVPLARTKMVQNFDGEMLEVPLPTPQILSELNGMALALPDAQAIRRAATKNRVMRSVYQSKGWGVPVAGMNKITTSLFKPMALLRPAYVVRIGAEEQARLTAAHHDSLFTHPFRFIMANVVNRDEMTDLMGRTLTQQARSRKYGIIARNAAGHLDDPVRSQARMFDVTSGPADGIGANASENFLNGWRSELGQLSSSPETRVMAELRGDLTEFKAWAQGDGRKNIADYAKGFDGGDDLLRFGGAFDEWARGLRTRVEAKTAGWDDEIIDHIAREDIPFEKGVSSRGAVHGFNDFMRRKISEGRAPAKVKYEIVPPGRKGAMDGALSTLFDVITAKPTNTFARFPTWRSSISRRTADMMDTLATDELREEAFTATIKALKLDRKTKAGTTTLRNEIKALREAKDAARGKQGVVDNIEDLNDIVLSRAADDVRDLLFDVSRRGAGQDTLNAIFPFLDAWKEVTVNWSRILKENPAFAIRAQAGYRELQDQGTFYVNDYGEEVFRYPGGGVLANLFGAEGAGMRLEGAVQGVNLIAQTAGPGFGPVVQWPATFLHDPSFDQFKEFLAPFGVEFDSASDLLDISSHANVFIPAWAEKGLNAFTAGGYDERQFNSTVGDHLEAHAASGDYDLNDPESVQQMTRDAKRAATFALFARAAYQFVGPTGPQAAVDIELDDVNPEHEDWDPEMDPDGKWFTLNMLSSDYYRLAQTHGFDGAAERFHEMYGTEPFFFAQGATTTEGRELPVTTEGGLWTRRNEDVMEDYPHVAGFWAPTDEDADLDFTVYNRQVDRGQRRSLSAEEQTRLAMNSRARLIWNAAKKRTEGLPIRDAERTRQNVRARLDETHPGWQAPVLAMPRAGDKIAELYRAIEDPRLAEEPLTLPLSAYLEARDRALYELRSMTGMANSTLARQDAAPLRAELLSIGARLQARYPQFTGVWTSILQNELEED